MTARPSRLVLLGHPVSHSLSPAFQNAALRTAGILLAYETLDVPPERLDLALGALAAEGAAGNVTVPHKVRVAERCATLTPVAARVGAVNTFWTSRDGLVGDNTDVQGYAELVDSLDSGAWSRGPVAVLGAGGAAAAVLAALESRRAGDVRLLGRDPERLARLVERFGGLARGARDVRDALADAAMVVNATPVGMRNDEMPVRVEMLPPGAVVVDLVYRAGETAWVRAARARGHLAADGREMLLAQGALAFERWFGVEPDRVVMRDALRRAVQP